MDEMVKNKRLYDELLVKDMLKRAILFSKKDKVNPKNIDEYVEENFLKFIEDD